MLSPVSVLVIGLIVVIIVPTYLLREYQIPFWKRLVVAIVQTLWGALVAVVVQNLMVRGYFP